MVGPFYFFLVDDKILLFCYSVHCASSSILRQTNKASGFQNPLLLACDAPPPPMVFCSGATDKHVSVSTARTKLTDRPLPKTLYTWYDVAIFNNNIQPSHHFFFDSYMYDPFTSHTKKITYIHIALFFIKTNSTITYITLRTFLFR